jgi:hypothetical protein
LCGECIAEERSESTEEYLSLSRRISRRSTFRTAQKPLSDSDS